MKSPFLKQNQTIEEVNKIIKNLEQIKKESTELSAILDLAKDLISQLVKYKKTSHEDRKFSSLQASTDTNSLSTHHQSAKLLGSLIKQQMIT